MQTDALLRKITRLAGNYYDVRIHMRSLATQARQLEREIDDLQTQMNTTQRLTIHATRPAQT